MAEYVRDEFTPRTVSNSSTTPGSWGTAEPGPGGAWSVSTSNAQTGFSVASGLGRWNIFAGTSGYAGYARLNSAPSVADAHGAFQGRLSAETLVAATTLWYRAAGPIDTHDGYGIKLWREGGMAKATLQRGPANAPTDLIALPDVPWATFGNYFTAELEITGSSPTRIKGRIWNSSVGTPPAADAGWTEITDSTGPQATGLPAFRFGRTSGIGTVFVRNIWQADPLRPAYTTSWDATGLIATFDSGISTGDPASWDWDFGDATAHATTPTATHAYALAGTYTVTLTLTTKWGTKRLLATVVIAPGSEPLPEPTVLPSIYLNGEDVCDRIFSASWRVGRTRWPDDALGSTLSLSIRGTLPDIGAGAKVVIQTPPGTPGGIRPLWKGDVDAISEDVDPVESKTITRITAMDALSFLGRWHILPATSMPEGPLTTRVASLAPRVGITYRQKWSGVAAARWPVLKSLAMAADNLRQRTYLDILRDGLRASIATAYVAPDGAIVYAPLDPPAGVTPPVLDLDITGPNCPDHLDRQRQSPEGLVNRWTVGDGSAVDRVERPSIEAYGESAWTVGSGVLKSDATFPLTDQLVAGLRDPFAAGVVTVPVRSWGSTAYLAEPLDSATLQGVLYGIMGTAHQIDYRNGWTVDLTLDRDPWSLTGTVPPVTPPTIKTMTQTFICDRDAMIVSPDMGAGKSGRLPVGYWEGDKFRALIRFQLAYAHTPTKILDADLLLSTAGQDVVGYGGSPAIHIDRITGSWSEGSAGSTSPPWTFSTGNAVVWPGPSVTTTGRKSIGVSSNENVQLTIGMQSIVSAWQSGSANHGICIRSQDEESASKTTEFYSREYGTSSRRPRLTVTYEYAG